MISKSNKFFSDKFSKSKQQAKKKKLLRFMFYATQLGDIEKVKRAFEHGVSPNAVVAFGGCKKPLLSVAAQVFELIFLLSKLLTE